MTKGTELLLTVSQVAERLQVSRPFVYALANQGRLPVIRFGRTVRIPKQALEQMIAASDTQDGAR